jgi:hypothetical protein
MRASVEFFQFVRSNTHRLMLRQVNSRGDEPCV